MLRAVALALRARLRVANSASRNCLDRAATPPYPGLLPNQVTVDAWALSLREKALASDVEQQSQPRRGIPSPQRSSPLSNSPQQPWLHSPPLRGGLSELVVNAM